MKIVCLDICLLFDRGDSVSLTRASQFAAKQVEASRMKVKVLLHCFFSSINSDKPFMQLGVLIEYKASLESIISN
jgi:hypothetical protein